MRHLSENFPDLVGDKRVGSAGIYSIDQYIYMFVLEDGINDANAASDAGYSGRSEDR